MSFATNRFATLGAYAANHSTGSSHETSIKHTYARLIDGRQQHWNGSGANRLLPIDKTVDMPYDANGTDSRFVCSGSVNSMIR
jgi:hypothetical protein